MKRSKVVNNWIQVLGMLLNSQGLLLVLHCMCLTYHTGKSEFSGLLIEYDCGERVVRKILFIDLYISSHLKKDSRLTKCFIGQKYIEHINLLSETFHFILCTFSLEKNSQFLLIVHI